ncbi:MAG: saccharopine dehydrogenase NADP-binding domain-containing protein [Ketobacteraceae bacterium]|nr:saccharopine dehydrogenase NADP-binding domain-containing protein [Ketobacteraceae bacterium]
MSNNNQKQEESSAPPQRAENRPYDIVIFGATGFTGELTAQYLAGCGEKDRLRWALAGRSGDRLSAIKSRLVAAHPHCEDVGLIEADISDHRSLRAMAEQTRVLITTVGPYLNYGEPVVKACVEADTHYVDLTGEPEFVDSMVHLYDEVAQKKQLKIVNSCGFDSIPHDLGALFTINALNELLGPERAGREPVILEGFVQAGGTFSGGTWHSAITQFSRLRAYEKKKRAWRKEKSRERSATERSVKPLSPGIRYHKAFHAWACPFPTIDPVVVRRTAKARPRYGPDFRYGHYVLVKTLPKIVAGGIGTAALVALSQFGKTRNLLLKVKDPGQGPTESEREKAWFRVRMIADAGGICVWSEITGGDPGYGETAKMLAESALCLAFDEDKTPAVYGVTTPGAAMGEPLIERLRAAGIGFHLLS